MASYKVGIFGALAASQIHTVVGAAKCSTQTASSGIWFQDMIFCAYDAGDYADLDSCFTGATWTTPAKDSPLDTVITSATGDCYSCLTTFYTSLKDKVDSGDIDSDCGASYDGDVVLEYPCMLALYDEINTFNTCNGGGMDVITGDATTRCTYAQFKSLEVKYLPYASMVGSAKASISDSPTSLYRARVSSGFSTRLDAVACGDCYDTLYTAITGVTDITTTACSSVHGSTCLSALESALDDFAVCTGGFRLHTDAATRCDDSESTLFDAVYRPYKGLVACSADNTVHGASSYEACMSEYNGLEEAPSSDCDSCYDTLLDSIEADKGSACSSASSSGCIDALSGVYGALPEFEICAGFAIDTESTRCTSYEWNGLDGVYKGYVDLLLEAIRMTDIFSTSDLIDSSIYLTGLSTARSGLTCSSCFDAFAADVYNAYTGSSTVQSDCANAYDEECFANDDIVVANDRFKSCSGYSLIYYVADQCTATEIATMTGSAVITALLDLGLNSTTSTQVAIGYAPIMELVGTDNELSTECSFCYWNLVNSLFDLSSSVQASCAADWSSTICIAGTTSLLAAFQACSGAEFDSLIPTSPTEAPATTEAPDTTTAPTTTTTAAPTTTTAAPTTEKGVKEERMMAITVATLLIALATYA